MKFLIQKNDNKIITDVGKVLVDNIQYYKFINKEYKIKYINNSLNFSEYHRNYIPIGTIEFTHEFLNKFYNIKSLKPINIPYELFKYSNRKIYNITKNDLYLYRDNKYYIKSNDTIKYNLNGILDNDNINEYLDENYQISSYIDNILSEWRFFIYKNEILNFSNYSGNVTILFDISKVKEIVNNYKDSPKAYTLDIGVDNNNNTFIIEIHNFYSCGLYGFNYKIPEMTFSWFNELIYKIKNK